jgi:hypothetical protein
LVEALSAAEVFACALRGASRQMESAARLLDDRKTDTATQRIERGAQKRFQDLIDVLKEDPKDREKDEPPEGQEGEQKRQGNRPPSESIPSLAQLKLLRVLQQELNDRTTELAERRKPNSPPTPAEIQEREAIANEQGELADLARNLTRAAMRAAGLPMQDAPLEEPGPKDSAPQEPDAKGQAPEQKEKP